LFTFLGNFNNFREIMPPQVSNWQSTEDQCSFNIQGMADIGLVIEEKLPFSSIRIAATAATPIPLWMTWQFSQQESYTDTSLIIDATLNPMLSMMVKTPLTNFVNLLVDKLNELAESGRIG